MNNKQYIHIILLNILCMHTTHAMYDEETNNKLRDIFTTANAQYHKSMIDTINKEHSHVPVLIDDNINCCLNCLTFPCNIVVYPCLRHRYTTILRISESSTNRLEKEKDTAFNNWMEYRKSANLAINDSKTENK